MSLGQSALRLRQMQQAERAHGSIEALVRERERLGIADTKFQIRKQRSRFVDHCRREVDPDRGQLARCSLCAGVAGAATNIEETHAWSGAYRVQDVDGRLCGELAEAIFVMRGALLPAQPLHLPEAAVAVGGFQSHVSFSRVARLRPTIFRAKQLPTL